MVKEVGDYSNKQHKDWIGLTIDLASNIHRLAKENGILIADILNWDFMQIDSMFYKAAGIFYVQK